MINKTNKKANKLIDERSPYLLQHAYNPVEWYPWGEEAFDKAKQENKPVFLSIGYSTCHWCHVMAHESFEDDEVAEILNKDFICVKVDREERPDIDNIYMLVCQLMTDSGGWPLTIIMTPEKKPFFAGTYFPKQSKFGRIGMMDLIPRIRELWKEKKEDILKSAENVINYLSQISFNSPGNKPDKGLIKSAYEQLSGYFDESFGGFGSAPKFPTPHNLLFLLRWWKYTNDEQALHMVEKTLQSMRQGGIYDHIGFGFHRYSTDSKWLVPHFEKMLYDQALISMAYTETYQATAKDEYRDVAEEIFSYILREMTDKEGGFYSADDADSEGEEGKFYVWTTEEIFNVLEKDEAEFFIKTFNLSEDGNYTDEFTSSKKKNIAHLKTSVLENDLRQRLEQIRIKLFNVRDKRIHPHKDDKILTSWNGLMVAAFAKAGRVFDKPVYTEVAEKAANFIFVKMMHDKKLMHCYRDGVASVKAHIDDFAFFIWGLIELYEATFDIRYLQFALELNEELVKYFWDKENYGFYFTSIEDENILVRYKEIYDGAIPSGNSIAMLNLLRLSKITGDKRLKEYANKLSESFSPKIEQAPMHHTMFLSALCFDMWPSSEIVLVGDYSKNETRNILKVIFKKFLPNKVVIFKHTNGSSKEISRISNYIEPYKTLNDKTTIYVCENFTCKKPVTEVNELLELL